MNSEKKEFILRTIIYTFMLTSIIIFSVLYDFNNVKEFIYSNF
ncbi:MAG: hypothetical protein PT934_07335 [Peptoniphilaceae bacterium]|nr:hypothetical protein [Parvimonas sp.]MDD7765564.1 hypothetical protein [Peptoniphilaceae bacterium]MDY3051105.1 hypothetical protein [Parvimonas sp.]